MAATLFLLLMAAFASRFSESVFGFLESSFSRLSTHRIRSAMVLAVVLILSRLAILPLLPVPVPGIHDEFSYLLMADTFVHGRLANPTHPMWISLETFHVNWFPTYSSMYPPAQGATLAIGQLVGLPWIGVLLSGAAMGVALFWMLCAWMPRRWAFLASALAALKLGIASYWMNSYWGGFVSAVGGALVLGAVARLVKCPRVRDALLLGTGVAILANSRPYEGLIFCLPAAFLFLRWLARIARKNSVAKLPWRSVVAPLLVVLVLTTVFMGYYNWRLTGNALLFPYRLNIQTYHSAPMFVLQTAKPELHYNNDRFEEFYNVWEREEYTRSWHDFLKVSCTKTVRLASTFLWWGLLFALPGLLGALRDQKLRVLWWSLLLTLVAIYLVVWSNAHYAAPATCLVFALIVESLRHLRTMKTKHFAWGKALARAVVVLLVMDTAVAVAQKECDPLYWTCTGDQSRTLVLEKLEAEPGKHLVMVRYNEDDLSVHDEWVFNGADLDGSKIVWARELSEQQNKKLFDYFRNRKIWLATTEDGHLVFGPYSPPEN